MYGLEHSAPEVRRAVLLQFRKHAAVTEPRILESLLARAAMEREETVNQWKQKGHLLAILHPENVPADPWLDEDEFFRRCVFCALGRGGAAQARARGRRRAAAGGGGGGAGGDAAGSAGTWTHAVAARRRRGARRQGHAD